MITVDFSKDKAQAEFLNTVLMAAEGKIPTRQIGLFGGIRNGKSIAALTTLTLLCKIYPGSRWAVYRKDFPTLQDTTVITLEEILGGSSSWRWNRASSNFYIEHTNKSRIYLYGENISQDPELNSILGLALNGVLLEQIEELSETLYNKIQSRLGSYFLKGRNPKPLLLATCNPTQRWPKEAFHDKWQRGELEEHKSYIKTDTMSSCWVTDDQREIFNRMDERTKQQYILGDWSDLRSKNDLFAYSFDRKKHVVNFLGKEVLEGNKNQPLWISLDFNRSAMCALVIQHYNETIYVLESIRLENSDIYQMIAYIQKNWSNHLYFITGDASGQNQSALVKDNLTYYRIIQKEMMLTSLQFKLPRANPHLENNQVLLNSVLSNYTVLIHEAKCKPLIFDLENVRCLPDGSIIKANRKDPTQEADQIDCLRYWTNMNMKQWLLSSPRLKQ